MRTRLLDVIARYQFRFYSVEDVFVECFFFFFCYCNYLIHLSFWIGFVFEQFYLLFYFNKTLKKLDENLEEDQPN